MSVTHDRTDGWKTESLFLFTITCLFEDINSVWTKFVLRFKYENSDCSIELVLYWVIPRLLPLSLSCQRLPPDPLGTNITFVNHGMEIFLLKTWLKSYVDILVVAESFRVVFVSKILPTTYTILVFTHRLVLYFIDWKFCQNISTILISCIFIWWVGRLMEYYFKKNHLLVCC